MGEAKLCNAKRKLVTAYKQKLSTKTEFHIRLIAYAIKNFNIEL